MSLFVSLQKLLPQHGLSRLVGKLAAQPTSLISKPFIHTFARAYKVNMKEALHEDLNDYPSFNDFFTRPLKAGVRPLPDAGDAIACPADGQISQSGRLYGGQMLQAKGMRYSLDALAGGLGEGFQDGTFCTVYLAPSDYHRVHVPVTGMLTESQAEPGALFSVNTATTRGVEGLFCRNERLICRFETTCGPMLVILVGALIVASIETVWGGPASPYRERQYSGHDLHFTRGDEMGRFLLGSTVIVCFAKGAVELSDAAKPGKTVRMGQSIGRILQKA